MYVFKGHCWHATQKLWLAFDLKKCGILDYKVSFFNLICSHLFICQHRQSYTCLIRQRLARLNVCFAEMITVELVRRWNIRWRTCIFQQQFDPFLKKSFKTTPFLQQKVFHTFIRGRGEGATSKLSY